MPSTIMEPQTPTDRRRRTVLGLTAGILAVAAVAGLALFVLARESSEQPTPATWSYEVIGAHPHDPEAFTQGLAYADGELYEGTGKYGRSTLRRIELATGKVLESQRLAESYFGEGITLFKGQVVQLTWKNQVAFVYDKGPLKYKRKVRVEGEGWGLTHDGKELIVSDGSSVLKFLDPKSFKVTRRLRVADRGQRIDSLNELEFVDGEVWANIWYQDQIARIDPKTGAVKGWIDLTGLLDPSLRPDREQVLNGIAYDPTSKRVFVTGKNWPRLFVIKIVPGSRL